MGLDVVILVGIVTARGRVAQYRAGVEVTTQAGKLADAQAGVHEQALADGELVVVEEGIACAGAKITGQECREHVCLGLWAFRDGTGQAYHCTHGLGEEGVGNDEDTSQVGFPLMRAVNDAAGPGRAGEESEDEAEQHRPGRGVW